MILTLDKLIKDSMINKNKKDLLVYKDIKNKLNEFLKVNKRKEISYTETLPIISKMIKMRNDTIKMAIKGNRKDIVDNETYELRILYDFMPNQLSEKELKSLFAEFMKQENITDISMRLVGMFKKYLDEEHEFAYNSEDIIKLIKNMRK